MGLTKNRDRIIMDYNTVYQNALEKPDSYWAGYANRLKWFKKWDKVIEKGQFTAKWFINGYSNIAYNSTDTHSGKGIIWYSENGKEIELTFHELSQLTQGIAKLMESYGVKKGSRVAIYTPNTIQGIASVLASARIGAIYTIIFAGLGEEAIKKRISDFKPDVIISAKYTVRRGKNIPLLLDSQITFRQKDDDEKEIQQLITEEKEDPVPIEANEPLKVMYTSGTTGKPKGIILPHGAWMVGDYTVFDLMFNLKPKDIVLTTTDMGWITFSRIMYGTLLHGSTFAFFEGAPDYPRDRLVKLIDELQPKVLFTSPTLLRTLKRYDIKLPRVEFLATAGEIFDEKTWEYASTFVDRITDVYGQTELGYVVGIPYSLDGVEPKPGYAGVPFPGVVLDTVDDQGSSVMGKDIGYLICKTPFPTQFIGVLNDDEKFKSYFSRFGYHDTGDLAKIDPPYVKIVGRADDMIKIAGHRITTGEVENLLMHIEGIKEVAVVGEPDEIKGEKLVVFYVGNVNENRIREIIRDSLGPIYVIDKVYKVSKLPKSKSGKIVRRILRDIVLNKEIDPTILEDPEVVKEIKDEISRKF